MPGRSTRLLGCLSSRCLWTHPWMFVSRGMWRGFTREPELERLEVEYSFIVKHIKKMLGGQAPSQSYKALHNELSFTHAHTHSYTYGWLLGGPLGAIRGQCLAEGHPWDHRFKKWCWRSSNTNCWMCTLWTLVALASCTGLVFKQSVDAFPWQFHAKEKT